MKTAVWAFGLAVFIASPTWAAPLEYAPGTQTGAQPGVARPGGALPSVARPSAAATQIRGDADGDRIEDGLAARIAASQAGDRFDVIVTFEGTDAVGRGRAAAGPFAVTREFSVVNGFQAQLTGPQIRGLSRAPGLFRISGNGVVTAHDIPSNNDMGATDARHFFDGFDVDGSGVTICVIDTGIDAAHEQFDTKGPGGLVPLGPSEFHDAINFQSNPYDDNGHGSHVSGIAAGDGNGWSSLAPEGIGVAPGASLVVAKVLNGAGEGFDAQVLDGIGWCAARSDVDILSMSLGGPGSDGSDVISVAVNCVADPSSSPTCNLSYAPKIVVVSAGNSGGLWSTIGAPGVAEHSITVGSAAEWSGNRLTNWQDDGLYLNTFSSRGPVINSAGDPVRIKPDIIGPGSRVVSAYVFNNAPNNSYGVASGTSMSAPFVSGVIALMLEVNPSLGDADADGLPHVKVRSILAQTAIDRGAPGLDNEYGHGIIDAYSAVAMADPTVTSYVPNAYPGYISLPNQSVADFDEWIEDFTVTSALVGLPIAGTATIDGTVTPICVLQLGPDCWQWADLWSPDLEVILEQEGPAPGSWSQVAGTSSEITFSECPARGECGTIGRVEVVHFTPLSEGSFRFRVFPADDTSNLGVGGDFDFEISMGAPVPAIVPNVAPTADFSFASSELTANFTDASSDSDGTIDGWSWNFGDGNFSTATNPSHIYADAGTYSVTLTVTDDDDGTGSDTQSVTVAVGNLAPTAGFTFSTSDLTASFTDGSTDTDGSIESRSWDFGDLSGTSAALNPSYTYTAAGTYSVTLTVTDDDGASHFVTQSVTVVPNEPPTAAYTVNVSDLTASFNDDSSDSDGTIASRSWDFGDSSALSSATNPSHAYAVADTYSVTLTVTDNDGDSDSFTQLVTVTEPPANVPPVASFTVDTPTGCGSFLFPNTCMFTDTSTDTDPGGGIVLLSWRIGDGPPQESTFAGSSILVTFPAGGPDPATITLTVTDTAGATDFTSMTLPISHPLPDPVSVHIADLDDMSASAPRNRWESAVAVLVSDNNGTPVSGATVDGIWSNGTNGGGSCITDTNGACTVTKGNLKNGVTQVTFSVDMITSAGLSYSDTANTDPDGDSNGTAIVLIQPGTAPVPTLTASFKVDRNPCGTDFFPNTCLFTDTSTGPEGSIVSWVWVAGDGAPQQFSSSGSQILPTFPAAGPNPVTVTLTVTDDTGAQNTASLTLEISHPQTTGEPPVAGFSFTTSVLTADFTDSSGDTDGNITAWSWDFGDGSSSTAQNPSHGYGSTGSYNVTLTVTDNDGNSNNITQTVTVTAPTVAVHVADLDGLGVAGQRNRWNATVTVLIVDAAGNLVQNATVSGNWIDGTSGGGNCTTGGDGRCTITKSNLKGNVSAVTFSVSSVSGTGMTYNAGANSDADGDSDGTTIIVTSP